MRSLLVGSSVLIVIMVILILFTDDSLPNKADKPDQEGQQEEESTWRTQREQHSSVDFHADSRKATRQTNSQTASLAPGVHNDDTDDQANSDDKSEEDDDQAYWEARRECVALVREKRFPRALVCFKAMDKQFPDDSEVQLGLGVASMSLGYVEETYHYYLKALELDPDGPRARQLEDLLNEYDRRKAGDSSNDSPGNQQTEKTRSPGPPTKLEIQDKLKENNFLINQCIEQQAEKDPLKSKGVVLFSFIVQPDGKLDKIALRSNEYLGSHVVVCISFILNTVRFNPFQGPPVVVDSFPFFLGD